MNYLWTGFWEDTELGKSSLLWQALKLPSQKGPMNETFPIFLEGFQPFGGLSTVKQSSHWVAGQTFDNRLPSRLQNMNENRAVWSV